MAKKPTTTKSTAKASAKKPSTEKSEPRKVSAEIVDDETRSSEDDGSVGSVDVIQNMDSAYDKNLDEELEAEIAATPEKTKGKMSPTVVSREITSSDPLVTYLNEIRKYNLLTREEEVALAKKYFDEKDPEAAQRLVQSNLRFVVKIAAEYSKFGSKMIDLIQEGNVGLMHAVKDFNPYKGVRLITYAVWWIRGYIQEYMMRQFSMVRIGTTQNQRKLFYQLQKEKKALENLGSEENLIQLSAKLGIPEDEVREMVKRMSGRDISLDKPMDSDGNVSLGDLQSSDEEGIDDQMARQEQLSILRMAVDELRPDLSVREIQLLDERILADEPLTLQEIGEKYKITREAVRQMEARLMKKIKTKLEEKKLD